MWPFRQKAWLPSAHTGPSSFGDDWSASEIDYVSKAIRNAGQPESEGFEAFAALLSQPAQPSAQVPEGNATTEHPLYDSNNPATSWALNPWCPMSRPIDLKHLGKLMEELGEAQSAVARCLIQGIDEREPVTHKLNREWLEDELADVSANIDLVKKHFVLNEARMADREERKKLHLRGWHSMLASPSPPQEAGE